MESMTPAALIIMAYADDTCPNKDLIQQIQADIALQHCEAFLNKVPSYDVYLLGPPNNLAHRASQYIGLQYLGEPIGATIQNIIKNQMFDFNKVIYIDDHSSFSDGMFYFQDHSSTYKLLYSGLLWALDNSGGGTQEIIVRGNRSGKALALCNPPQRKVFCSMGPGETKLCDIDSYNLAPYIENGMTIEQAHDAAADYLSGLAIQYPVKCP